MSPRHGLAALSLLLLLVAPAWAGPPTERLRDLFEQANRVLLAPDPDGGVEARVEALRGLVNEVFDVRDAAALALGAAWDERTPAEQEEFTRLYGDLVERAYMAWIGSKARVGERGVTVRWVGEHIEGAKARVQSAIATRSGAELPVEYDMSRREGRWVVRDVVVDGLSLAASYHAQVQRVLQVGSYAELRERLYDKASPRTQAALARLLAPAPVAGAVVRRRPDVVERPVEVVAVADPPRRVEALATPVEVAAPPDPPRRTDVPPVPARVAAMGDSPARLIAAPVASSSTRPAVVPAMSRGTETRPAATRFWVQVGAFRQMDAAVRMVERLPATSVTVTLSSDRAAPLARVLVGPFSDRGAATAMARQLTAAGFKPFIALE